MKEETEKMLVDAIINLGVGIENLRKDMNGQLAKVNLGLNELRLSYMKLDERVAKLDDSINAMRFDFNKYAESNNNIVKNHESRITHLEKGSSYMAREPRVPYKKTKKKK